MSSDVSPNKDRKILKLFLIVSIFFIIIVIIGIIFDRLSITIKNQNQKVILHSIVCNDEIINQYNDLIQSNNYKDYGNNFKIITDKIEALPDHNDDPNCSFILYYYYFYKLDATKSRQYADQLKKQSDSGDYISGKIINPNSVQRIQDYVKSLEGGDNNGSGGNG